MTVRCGICGRDFATEEELRGHEHGPDPRADDGLACAACGERFERVERLVEHQSADHVGIEVADAEDVAP